MHGMSMAEGAPAREASFADCKRRCIRTSNCIGIDVDVDPKSVAFCWLSIKDTSLSPHKGMTHLNLTRTKACEKIG